MPTNITINTVESAAVVYLQDGSHIVVDPQSETSFQLIDNGYCSITEVADPDESEHPPQLPPGFISQLIKWWQYYGPKATPL